MPQDNTDPTTPASVSLDTAAKCLSRGYAPLPIPFPDRIADRIDVGDCWVWQGATRHGYACVWWDGRLHLGHRLIYEALIGPIPEGLQLDHLCRVRACVNPEHLEPVTSAENTRRGSAGYLAGPRPETCRHGHSYADAYWHGGKRRCRTCRQAAGRRHDAKRRSVR